MNCLISLQWMGQGWAEGVWCGVGWGGGRERKVWWRLGAERESVECSSSVLLYVHRNHKAYIQDEVVYIA